MIDRCPVTVIWEDIEIKARCISPAGHSGYHRDGIRWFDERGFQVDGTTHHYQGWKVNT